MSGAGAHAGAQPAAAHAAENDPAATAAKVAAMKRTLRAVRALCETRAGDPLAAEITAILDREE